MLLEKIKVGKTYPYVSRTVGREENARGKVVRTYAVGKGSYVELFDKERNKTVAVRPSQVDPK